MSPSERSLRSRLSAHTLHALVKDPAAHTAPARRAFAESFEKKVDPDGLLDPAERARRGEHLRRAHMARLALKSVQARRRKSASSDDVDTTDVSASAEADRAGVTPPDAA